MKNRLVQNPGKNLFQSFAQEKIKHSGLKEVLLNLLGAIALLFLLNGVANLFLKYLIVNQGQFLASYKWNLLLDLEEPVDWLVLGDSSCNQGVIPEILSEELGGSALNMCIFGPLLMFNDAWMLEQHIRQVGPPKHVIIIHVYDLWGRELTDESFAHLSRLPLSSEEIKTFTPSLELNLGHKLQWFSYRYLHLYTSSETLGDFIREPFETFREGREYNVTATGFMPKYEPNPLDVEEDVQDHLDDVDEKTFSISEINQRSLEAIRDLAEQHEFDVYFMPSPLYEGLVEERQFRRYLREVERGLEQFTKTSDRLHVVMREPITFEADQMENADHIIESAARIYTRRLAEQIGKEQARP